MTPHNWTALGLRLLGVYMLWSGLWNIVDAVAIKMDWWMQINSDYLPYYMLHGVVDAVFGFALFRKAESLASFAIESFEKAGAADDAGGEVQGAVGDDSASGTAP